MRTTRGIGHDQVRGGCDIFFEYIALDGYMHSRLDLRTQSIY